MLSVLYSVAFLEHKPPFPHPERPDRLLLALEAVERSGISIELVEPRSGSVEDLHRVHEPDYVARIARYVGSGVSLIDSDTYLSPGTMRAALAAAGASLQAAELAARGEGAFALVRPPGHHASKRGRAMGAPTQGFCVFNNAALAVARLLELGLRRVAVVDFDAHHGNGTQEIFYSDPCVLHIDLHEDPTTLYPGTGFPVDVGEGEGEGTKVNVVLPPGSSDDVYALAIEEIVIPLLGEFKPETLVFSAGFDAFDGDGLTHLKAGERAFQRLGEVAREIGAKGVAAILEGGYSEGLEFGLPAFLRALEGMSVDAPLKRSPEPILSLAREYMTELKALLRRYWRL
ncbi:MAG: histone deacetylase family protein [Thermofilum sp.]